MAHEPTICDEFLTAYETVLDRWEDHLKDRGLKHKTITKKLARIRYALDLASANGWPEAPELVRKEHIASFEATLKDRSYPARKLYLSNLNEFLAFANRMNAEGVN